MNAAEAIPHYMRGGLIRWITIGEMPGSFLQAILSNDLKEACGRADDTNIELLPVYVRFLYQHAPPECYGSPLKCAIWMNRRRQHGPFDWEWPT